MAAMSSRSNCPIEFMFFDLDESLTLQRDPGRRISASTNSIIGMPTVDVAANGALVDACSVCMEGFRPGEGVKQVPCGHVYHQACIAEWSMHHNSCPLGRSEIFQED